MIQYIVTLIAKAQRHESETIPCKCVERNGCYMYPGRCKIRGERNARTHDCLNRPGTDEAARTDDRLEHGDDDGKESGRQRRLVVQQLHGVDVEFLLLLGNPLQTNTHDAHANHTRITETPHHLVHGRNENTDARKDDAEEIELEIIVAVEENSDHDRNLQ